MKIMVIGEHPELPTGFGGQARFLVHTFLKAGHEVSMIACNYSQATVEDYYGAKLYCLRIVPSSLIYTELFEQEKPDVIVCLLEISWTTEMLDISNRWTKKIMFWIPIDCQPFPELYQESVDEKGYMVFMSEFGKEIYQDHINIPSCVIPHAVDVSMFRPIEKRDDLRKKYNYDDKFVVLHVGKNQSRKMQPLIIESYAEFMRDKDDTFLILHTSPNAVTHQVGGGWDLVALCRDRMKMPNNRYAFSKNATNEGMPLLYNCADVFILLSIGEGFGVPLIESMACGIQPISADNSTTPEILDKYGWKVKCKENLWHPGMEVYRPLAEKEDAIRCLNEAYQLWKEGKLHDNKKEMVEYTKSKYSEEVVKDQWVKVVEEFGSGFVRQVKTNKRKLIYQGLLDRNNASSYIHVGKHLMPELEKYYEVYDLPFSIDECIGLKPEIIDAHEKISEASFRWENPDVHIRFTHPPQPTGMVGKVNLNICPWEWDTYPCSWIRKAHNKNLHGIVMLSKSGKDDMIQAGFPEEKSFGISLACEHDTYKPEGSKLDVLEKCEMDGFDYNKDMTVFLVSGMLMQPNSRKNAGMVVDAFMETFTKKDNVVLIIKSLLSKNLINQTRRDEFEEYLIYKTKELSYDKTPWIVNISTWLTKEEMASLYRLSNFGFNVVCGGGFEICPLEMMACGVVPVVPCIGGMRDYVTENNAYVIESTRQESLVLPMGQDRNDSSSWDGKWYWQMPNKEHLKYVMRRLVLMKNTEEVTKKRENGLITAKQFTWERTAEELNNIVKSLQ